jgi:hypothetical protein
MYKVETKITIKQITQIVGEPLRDKMLTFNFVNEFSCTDSWRDFTNSGEITFPKKLYFKDKYSKPQRIDENFGGFGLPSFIMRGDAITIDYYYRYYKNGVEIIEGTENTKNNTHLFDGYITEVTSKKPLNLKFEDVFWRLKQTDVQIQTFKKTDTLYSIISTLIKPYNDKYPNEKIVIAKPLPTEVVTFGEFMVGNETVAECFGRMRKTWHFETYIKNEPSINGKFKLYCGIILYDALVPKTRVFEFQRNIISDDLEYRKKEDIILSIVASNSVEVSNGVTKDGKIKTKKERLEVLVTLAFGSDKPIVKVKEPGVDFAPNSGGERLTMQYPMCNTISELTQKATEEIRKYYYTGYKGKFTTFGIPYTQTGDNIQIVDNILPERNGIYKCKGVEYSVGMGGIRQTIQLDYKIS